MARHLTTSNIEAICGLLDGWRGPLTWNALVDAVEGLLGHRYTRQALNNQQRIVAAYKVRKNVLRGQPESAPRGTLEMVAAQERIARLKAENERLHAENEQLLSQFVRWAYNASIRGLDQTTLNSALPPIDRERTNVKHLRTVR